MPVERSAGAIIFRRADSRRLYLLLNYPRSSGASEGYLDFPKGHIEKGEKELDTVRREVAEETGLNDIRIVGGFKEWIRYFFKAEGKNIFKIVTFYLAETQQTDVKISYEHTGYVWLTYEEAQAKLAFQNARQILKKADDYLAGHKAGDEKR